ncbi:2-dehydro-3-deoxygalactonokinase [Xaviernesmea oryzae]|uniref:2-dehydro-3-deoxygalactonokinase n=1 Tax=Xaviernesmea oryzae TaxID=464029 RepID=A0A1Q9ATH6_9HYPH|nr:2-dehydro-3-deoxygalactonokinase [Xaviernesmea oryzae]OLP58737.1 2-dehydro-3-deoxygalactonokinase [Xaviernesmea oryzae]SEK70760.1 2-dehydro-3-deoxygalactonokinase [Xaviernesmea oryzae]
MTATAASYAAVDWGTSSFRLWLIGKDGTPLGERRSGEGMTTAAQEGFSAVLERHLAALDAPADLPVMICGMAGARQGWMDAGYMDVPARLEEIVGRAVVVPHSSRDIRILPGLAQRIEAAPDVMRGEETQLLGAYDEIGAGSHLLCMPGTHSKWVRLRDGAVEGFSTFMTGELFDVIGKQSILRHALDGSEAFDGTHPAFIQAVKTACVSPARFSNLIFSARSGQLLHGLDATSAKARLSGLLIGLEIAGARDTAPDAVQVQLVASGAMAALYEAALSAALLGVTVIDADLAVRRGLQAAARAVWP